MEGTAALLPSTAVPLPFQDASAEATEATDPVAQLWNLTKVETEATAAT
jgi:hypothetical protein